MGASQALSIYDYLSTRLRQLENFTPEPSRYLREILTRICTQSSVFPTINLDQEGGVSAVWHAGGVYSLEVGVDSDLCGWATLMEPPRRTQVVELAKDEEFNRIQLHLGALSAYVKRHNPDWRQLVTMP